MNQELRLELNVTVNDPRLTRDQLREIIKIAIERGLMTTSYGISVDSVRNV